MLKNIYNKVIAILFPPFKRIMATFLVNKNALNYPIWDSFYHNLHLV